MQKEFSYNKVKFPDSSQKVEKAFKSCAEDLEKKLPDLKKVHFSVKKDEGPGKAYAIDLRAVSKSADILFSVETKNLFRGLKIVKNATLQKLREDKKKQKDKKRRKTKEKQLEFLMKNYDFKEAL